MVKVYLTYITDETWQKQVTTEQKEHKELVNRIRESEVFPTMSKDPLSN
jgi:transcription antitermination factor NusA-like protein